MHTVPLDANVSRSSDRQIGLRLPVVVDEHVEHLIRLAEDAGERTSRRELISALLATCDLDGQQVRNMIGRYRVMKVAEIRGIPHGDADSVVLLSSRRPGPRSSAR